MATVTDPIILDSTGQDIVTALQALNGTRDTAADTTSFTSSDVTDGNATSWTVVPPLQSGETQTNLFGKLSQIAKNVRYLYKMQVLAEGTGYKVTKCGRIINVTAYYYLGNIYLNDMPIPANNLNTISPIFVGNTIVGSIAATTDGKIQIYASGSDSGFGSLTYIAL